MLLPPECNLTADNLFLALSLSGLPPFCVPMLLLVFSRLRHWRPAGEGWFLAPGVTYRALSGLTLGVPEIKPGHGSSIEKRRSSAPQSARTIRAKIQVKVRQDGKHYPFSEGKRSG